MTHKMNKNVVTQQYSLQRNHLMIKNHRSNALGLTLENNMSIGF